MSLKKGQAPKSARGVCTNRNHSPRLRGSQWVCPDCEAARTTTSKNGA